LRKREANIYLLDYLKSQLHQAIEALFASASVDEMAGDMDAYQGKLEDIAAIAKTLGIDTKIVTATLYLTEDPNAPA